MTCDAPAAWTCVRSPAVPAAASVSALLVWVGQAGSRPAARVLAPGTDTGRTKPSARRATPPGLSAVGWRSRSRPVATETGRSRCGGVEGLTPGPADPVPPLHPPSGEIAAHLPAHGFTIAAHLPAHGLAIAAHLAARGFAPHAARTLPRRPRCLPWPQTSASPLPGGCRSPEGTSGPRPSASLTADTRGARRSPHGCPGRTAQTLPRKSAGPTGLTPEPAEGPWSLQKQPSTPTR